MDYVGFYNRFSAARFSLLLTHLGNPAIAIGDAIRESEKALTELGDHRAIGDDQASRHLRRLSKLTNSYNISLSAGGPLGTLPPNEQHQLAESVSFLADWFLQRVALSA